MRSIPLIWLDVTYFKCRCGGRAASTAAATSPAGGRCSAYRWWTRSRMTRGSASCMRRATVAPPATSSSVSDAPGPDQGHRRGLPGGRPSSDARLHARGRLLAAEAPRGAHRLLGLPRRGRRHRRGHVPRGVRDAGGVLPGGGKGARGGGA